MIIEPSEIALRFLEILGVDFGQVFNERGGIKRQQLKILNKVNAYSPVKTNAYKTIHRLEQSPNQQMIDYQKNLKNTLVGTIKTSIMLSLDDMPKKSKQDVIIRWIPSEAQEQDPIHALNYGKTMTLELALQKGLGTRYGCQCAFEVISGGDIIEANFKKSVITKGEIK